MIYRLKNSVSKKQKNIKISQQNKGVYNKCWGGSLNIYFWQKRTQKLDKRCKKSEITEFYSAITAYFNWKNSIITLCGQLFTNGLNKNMHNSAGLHCCAYHSRLYWSPQHLILNRFLQILNY